MENPQSLKSFVNTFVADTTKNISELDEVSVDTMIYHDGKGTNEKGEEFEYSYIKVNDIKYRITSGALSQLKELLEDNPNLKKFKVKRKGEGKTDTKYTVIPIL